MNEWFLIIPLVVLSTYISRRNKQWFSYLSRRLWAIVFAIDVTVLILTPGWWKILGLVSVVPSAAGLFNPLKFHNMVRRLLYRKLATSVVDIYKFDHREPDEWLERAQHYLKHEGNMW